MGEKVGDLMIINGIVDQKVYHSILQCHLVPSGKRLCQGLYIFQQDNDPKHTSNFCKHFLKSLENLKVMKIMVWSPQSPDLNAIELLWEELDRKVRAQQPTSA